MRRLMLFSSVLALAVTIEAQTPAGEQSRGAPQAAAQAAPAGNAENGKKIYGRDGCYQCHGWEGQGGGAGARLAPRPMPYAGFLRYIRRPTNQMPPYTEKVLPDQAVADIYAFLQTIPPPPALNSIPELANP